MRTYESLGLGIPEILLPREDIDLTKWAVIACDQYTSEPEYWERVAAFVGGAPSALDLIYPEVYLNAPDREARIARIRRTMDDDLARGLFRESDGLVYVERTVGGRTRGGLMVCLDLEHYDYRKGATSLIRATEGTILERIPPRVKIREGAPLEIPHIMVLIDDPGHTIIGPLAAGRARLEKLYDFELMMDAGHLSGYRIRDARIEDGVVKGLASLADPEGFVKKYRLEPGTAVLLYAMGDGNHSLATAKAIWEKTKKSAADKKTVVSSPLRYALVELVNLHDKALVFEPIHRLLYGLRPDAGVVDRIKAFYPGRCRSKSAGSLESMTDAIDGQRGEPHKVGLISPSGFDVVEVEKPNSNLPVGTLQDFLDAFLQSQAAREIDYVHGTDALVRAGGKPGNAGFYLPAMRKEDLFKTVIIDGALPRKTFSMGEAREKRFYLEARRLI